MEFTISTKSAGGSVFLWSNIWFGFKRFGRLGIGKNFMFFCDVGATLSLGFISYAEILMEQRPPKLSYRRWREIQQTTL